MNDSKRIQSRFDKHIRGQLPPIIDLNGSASCYTGSVYNDADVTVWDNDPGYAGSVTSNATLLGTSDGTYTIVIRHHRIRQVMMLKMLQER